MIQFPESAEFTGMSQNALPTGLVDEILSPQDLAQTIAEIVRIAKNMVINTNFKNYCYKSKVDLGALLGGRFAWWAIGRSAPTEERREKFPMPPRKCWVSLRSTQPINPFTVA